MQKLSPQHSWRYWQITHKTMEQYNLFSLPSWQLNLLTHFTLRGRRRKRDSCNAVGILRFTRTLNHWISTWARNKYGLANKKKPSPQKSVFSICFRVMLSRKIYIGIKFQKNSRHFHLAVKTQPFQNLLSYACFCAACVSLTGQHARDRLV